MGIPIGTSLKGGIKSAPKNPSDSMNWGKVWGETKDVFSMGASTWLDYQKVKREGDFNGKNQREVYEKPTTATPEPNPPQVQPVKTVGGVPVTYLAVGGLLLVGTIILVKL